MAWLYYSGFTCTNPIVQMIWGSPVFCSSWIRQRAPSPRRARDQFGESFVGNAAAEFTVEDVGGGLPQRITVDFLDGLAQFRRVEERHALDIIQKML